MGFTQLEKIFQHCHVLELFARHIACTLHALAGHVKYPFQDPFQEESGKFYDAVWKGDYCSITRREEGSPLIGQERR